MAKEFAWCARSANQNARFALSCLLAELVIIIPIQTCRFQQQRQQQQVIKVVQMNYMSLPKITFIGNVKKEKGN